METRFRIGIFSSTHGIRGEIKVYPTTDDPARFTRLKEVILETKTGLRWVGRNILWKLLQSPIEDS